MPKTLALFLSHKGSLTRWRADGILGREMALYLEFVRNGAFEKVVVFSYCADDLALLADLQVDEPLWRNIELITPVVRKRNKTEGLGYAISAVFRHNGRLKPAAWIKTNQISGAWAAAWAAMSTGAPLMLRQGYSLSRRLRLNKKPIRAFVAARIEAWLFKAATVIVVTSKALEDDLKRRAAIANKVVRSPTYVDMRVFTAKTEYAFDAPALFVGRLEPQKNPINTVLACRRAGLAIDLVGSGSLEPQLRAIAAQPGPPIRFHGLMSNEDLAAFMRRHCIFVLASLHEGLPKVLLEAMASGLVCVGAPIPGILDLVSVDRTGYLCRGHSVDAIAETLVRARDEKRADFGRAAHDFIAHSYGLINYAQREVELFQTRGPQQTQQRAAA